MTTASDHGKVLTAWVHVSDVHFGHGGAGHQWDQRLITEELLRDVAEVVDGGRVPRPQQIFVTGDIAFSGGGRTPVAGGSEYGLAAAWLDQLAAKVGLAREQVFLVPGNHDVDRSVDSDEDIQNMVELARVGKRDVDTLLGTSKNVARLRQRMAGYFEFAQPFGPASREVFCEGLWWRHGIELDDGINLRICGFNTALLSVDNHDRGKLRLGNRQLGDLLLPLRDEREVVLALSHHPVTGGWLADEQVVRGRLDLERVVHLYGHLHEAESKQVRHGWGAGSLRIAAGAAHAEATGGEEVPTGHGYNFGALVLLPDGEIVVRIWPRRRLVKSTRFVADVENIDEAKGYAEHSLLRVPTERAPPPPVPSVASLPPRGPSSTAEPMPALAPPPPLVLLLNVGGPSYTSKMTRAKLESAPSLELEGATYLELEHPLDRGANDPAAWRRLAEKLDAWVREAEGYNAAQCSRCVIAGQAPLPVFLYLGQRMQGMTLPITYINLRRGEAVWDRIEAPRGREPASDGEFDVTGPTPGDGGSLVLAIQCSSQYAYSDAQVMPTIRASGGDRVTSYTIQRQSSHRSVPMDGDVLEILVGYVDRALRSLAEQPSAKDGLTVALGGPAWVAFWVGNRLNPHNFGNRLRFPSFSGNVYVPALEVPWGDDGRVGADAASRAEMPVGQETQEIQEIQETEETEQVSPARSERQVEISLADREGTVDPEDEGDEPPQPPDDCWRTGEVEGKLTDILIASQALAVSLARRLGSGGALEESAGESPAARAARRIIDLGKGRDAAVRLAEACFDAVRGRGADARDAGSAVRDLLCEWLPFGYPQSAPIVILRLREDVQNPRNLLSTTSHRLQFVEVCMAWLDGRRCRFCAVPVGSGAQEPMPERMLPLPPPSTQRQAPDQVIAEIEGVIREQLGGSLVIDANSLLGLDAEEGRSRYMTVPATRRGGQGDLTDSVLARLNTSFDNLRIVVLGGVNAHDKVESMLWARLTRLLKPEEK